MTPLRLVMMGTGEFALPTFESLYTTPHPVVGLCTQPDRIAPGRKTQHPNPLKNLALARGTSVLQPPSVNAPEGLASLRALNPDVLVVAAYGQILSPELLAIPRVAAINVHASLLPRHRGAAPVAYSIWTGDTETGVSIIQILPALDAGPVLSITRTPIDPRETAGQLEDRLAVLGAALIPPVLDRLAAGPVTGEGQDPALVTRCPKLKKEQGEIDWSETTRQIDCRVRAMQPWPQPYSYLHTADHAPQRLLILAVRRVADGVTAPHGQIVRADRDGLWVQAADGVVEVVTLQPPGKRAMSASEFLRGHPLTPQCQFGPEGVV